MHAVLKSAKKAKLIHSNPAEDAELPKLPKRKWRLLKPGELPALCNAFGDVRARRIFLTLTLTGLRRCEVRELRWEHVSLTEAKLQVAVSKTDEGERYVAIPPMLVRELEAQFAETRYKADRDFVFAHPQSGNAADFSQWYPREWQKALAAAGITDYIRPCHDMRHTALTTLAAANTSGPVLMAIAGHRSCSTTKRYIDLAGVTFPAEMEALEQRLMGAGTSASRAAVSTESSTRLSESQPISGDLSGSETRMDTRD